MNALDGRCTLDLMRIAACAVLLTLGVGCSQSAAPTAPTRAACETNRTADVLVVNRSPAGLTYDLTIDGTPRGAVLPGQTVGPFVLAAETMHVFGVRGTTTQQTASIQRTFAVCAISTLIVEDTP